MDVVDRFLRYVAIDTQSEDTSADKYPSTEKQKNLALMLVEELKELGLTDAVMDDYGYVMATLPGTLKQDQISKIPVIGLLAHLDTSPEVSGRDVKPLRHSYTGGDISLPSGDIIRADENPELKKYIGTEIITSSGDTLLGADNKAGIAEIMAAIAGLISDEEIKHGDIRIGFTPDEEIGAGTRYFDLQKFGADFAYTVDGGREGEVENENFNAFLATFRVKGLNLHPGYAKGKMVNAVRIVADIIHELKSIPGPENTECREGFCHPYELEGNVESALVKVLIRDFELEGIDEKRIRLQKIRRQAASVNPGAEILLEVREQYRNMRLQLEQDNRVVDYALEAVSRAGLKSRLNIIRGGSDGARLSFKGLLTPNLFTGGMNFHSKHEWIAVNAMTKAVDTIMHLVQIWAERSLV